MSEGLTPEEELVLMSLVSAWKRFVALSEGHPDDVNEFRTAIHAAQCIIAARVAKRVNPEIWV